MRYIYSLLILLALISPTAWANAGKDIVTGAFSSSERADSRNTKLNAYLQKDPTVSPLLRNERFTFGVKLVRGYYRSVLTNFKDANDIPVVLDSVKKVLPDAYLASSSADADTKQSTTQASAVAPAAAAVQAAPEVTQNQVAPEEPEQSDAATDESVTEEPSETPAAQAVESPEVVTVQQAAEETVIAPAGNEAVSQTVIPTAPAQAEPPYLTYGIIGAGAVLIVLLFVALRRKTPKKALHEFAETEAAEAAEETEMPAYEEETEAEEEIQPAETPKPAETYSTFEEVPVLAEEWHEIEVPHVEEAEEIEVPEAFEPAEVRPQPKPEAFEPVKVEPRPKAETAVPAPKAAPASRKKRNLPAGMKTASIEDLADFAGNRILVAEDNLINQKVLSKLLGNSGIELVMADNGQIAIDTLQNDQNFGMILMDAHMPIKDGFAASREIRGDRRFDNIVIVALSGDVSSDDIRKMREAGMEEQLAKPLKVDALYNVMYQYLTLAGEEEAAAAEAEAPQESLFEANDALNTEEGLDICGGDKEMYAEILDEFVMTYGDSAEVINNYIRTNNEIKMVQLTLDLKGVAANIGANHLSEAAETLREAVLVNHTESYQKLADEYKSELQLLLAAIDAFKKTL